MTTFSVSLTNRTVFFPQSGDSSPHVSEAKCPPRPTHLPLLHRVGSTDQPVPLEWHGGILIIFWLPKCREQERVHKKGGTSIAPIAETDWSTRTCDISLGSLAVTMPEARDFVESIAPD